MRHPELIFTLLLVWLISCGEVASGQGPAPAQGPVPIQGAARPGPTDGRALQLDPEYRIGPEDLLQISVWKNEAMSRTVSVRPDGMISLPLLNEVRAAGLTPAQLRDVLMKKLTEYMPDPDVSVIVQEVRHFKVSVIGEVARPGRFELKSRTTVLDAIALAGGFKDFASRARIVILRPEGNAMKRIPFNYNTAISDGKMDEVYLRPGDVVVVP